MSAYRQALQLLSREGAPATGTPGFQDYERLLPALEAAMWAGPDDRRVAHFQAFCREMEERSDPGIAARRHHLVVVVPVADRPRQLAACIRSLSACQAAFGYSGGLTLVVVEDSLLPRNARAHRALLDGAGLDARYLGLEEQRGLLESLGPEALPFVGEQWRAQMGHKGASVTRNIAMLWLARQGFERPLFHFIDSDQAFHVEVGAERPRYLLNYFYHIDRLFREHGLSVLTGKVVGDPPVSPAVMAGTLLDDVLQVTEEVLASPGKACGFHGGEGALGHGAYHDMAALFGLDNRAGGWRHACPLEGPHSRAEALELLSGRLLRFFDGEHPTRVTPFEYTPVEQSLAPARTVYTGNYVIDRRALRFCIPFAPMKLRMAGPTLGRLLQGRLGGRFAQANLPLLHRRTEESTGRAEFRTGIDHRAGGVDVSDEYERQFIGDWMLFSIVELVGRGYPDRFEASTIDAVLREVEQRLLDEYAATRARVLERLGRLQGRLDEPSLPWREGGAMRRSAAGLRAFAGAVRANYGEHSRAVEHLADAGWRAQWRGQLARALAEYPGASARWCELLERSGSG